MNENNLLPVLEAELEKIKNQVTRKPLYKLNQTMINNFEEKILSFNNYYYYNPAEFAIVLNNRGITNAINKDWDSAISLFREAIDHFEHPTIICNLMNCLEKSNQSTSLNEINEKYDIVNSYEYFLSKNSFLAPVYIAIDKKNLDASSFKHLLGYNFVFEKANRDENSILVFNVPYVVWREFYTVFLHSLENENCIITKEDLMNHGDLFLYEVENKPYINEQMDKEVIPLFPLIELKVSTELKDYVLNSYKTFIIDFFLKRYNSSYQFEEWASADPTINDYYRDYGEKESMYGLLKSAIFNVKANKPNPFLEVNQEEYYRGVAEFRTFFPQFFPNEDIIINYLEQTLEASIINIVSNPTFKQDLKQVLQDSITSIKSHPNSIFLHLRKSLELTFRYILENDIRFIKLQKSDLPLYLMIKNVVMELNNKQFIYEPILDVVNAKNNYYITKSKFKQYIYDIKDITNKKIHFDWKERETSMEQIDSKSALNLFETNLGIITILIKEFKL